MKKTVDGLILRERAVGENDKLLTVLTAKEGKILMTAKGARSMKSKVLSLGRQFTYANLEYYEKNDRCWLSGGSVNNSFFGLSRDMEDFALAAYIIDVAGEITVEGVEAQEILRMTLNTLYAIENKLCGREQIKAVYELFAAQISGMFPDISGCACCGRADGADFVLDVMNGRLICRDCRRKQYDGLPMPETDELQTRNILLPINDSALAAMRYVASAAPARIFAFGLTDKESLRCFCRAAETYLLHHLERSFDTLSFYQSIKES